MGLLSRLVLGDSSFVSQFASAVHDEKASSSSCTSQALFVLFIVIRRVRSSSKPSPSTLTRI